MSESIQPTNPLITDQPADTINHCQQALAIVELAIAEPDNVINEDDRMGYFLILTCVRQALRYEVEHCEERQPGNVTKLVKEDSCQA